MILDRHIPAALLRPRRDSRLWTDRTLGAIPAALLAAGFLATTVSALRNDPVATARFELLGCLALLAGLGTAHLVHRASSRLIAPTIVVVALYGIVRAIDLDQIRSGRPVTAGPPATGGVVAVLTAALAVGLVATLVGFVRVRRGHVVRSIVADTTIVTLAGWVLTWVLIVRPMIELDGSLGWATVVRASLHVITLPICFLLILLVFSGRRHVPAVWLIALGLGTAVVGGWFDGLAQAGWFDLQRHEIAAIHVLALFIGAAAFSHRSIGRIADQLPHHRSHSPATRIMLTVACLPVPALMLVLFDPSGAADRLVRTLSLIALTMAITFRVADSIHSNNVAHQRLLRQAQQDTLTSLPNRTMLGARISDALATALNTGSRPTLLFIGLDRFKNINDSLGHDVGDEVLRLVARRLNTAMPSHAHVARIAGDEFVVLDPTIRSVHEANSLAARALSLFREPLHVGAGDMYVMASIGVAVANPASTNAQELQRNADTAMCRAKESGGNAFQMFDEAMYERVFHRLEIESGLHRALERRELQLYYQPILDLVSGEVTGFEALMRWQMADGRIVSPAEFIPVAEDTGLIIGIGNWALLEALTQLRTWIDEGVCTPTTTMSVNVSPRQLRDPSLISAVNEALRRSQVPPRNVWLEVTESVMIAEPDQALAALRRLRSLDVRLAIDDFGTGYSSLSLLRKFPLQRIKIDRSFISGMTDDENAHSLVRTIVAMAASLNLDLVAEGLEEPRPAACVDGDGLPHRPGIPALVTGHCGVDASDGRRSADRRAVDRRPAALLAGGLSQQRPFWRRFGRRVARCPLPERAIRSDLERGRRDPPWLVVRRGHRDDAWADADRLRRGGAGAGRWHGDDHPRRSAAAGDAGRLDQSGNRLRSDPVQRADPRLPDPQPGKGPRTDRPPPGTAEPGTVHRRRVLPRPDGLGVPRSPPARRQPGVPGPDRRRLPALSGGARPRLADPGGSRPGRDPSGDDQRSRPPRAHRPGSRRLSRLSR